MKVQNKKITKINGGEGGCEWEKALSSLREKWKMRNLSLKIKMNFVWKFWMDLYG